uniref:PDZ domain-containing protein n=1 Tax=Noctiluca scintillans TaxID=2966 RepID=A0A7S1F0X9_NOCSC
MAQVHFSVRSVMIRFSCCCPAEGAAEVTVLDAQNPGTETFSAYSVPDTTELLSGTEFCVVLSRSKECPQLGLNIKVRDGSVKVHEIRAGLVQNWNLANPERNVRVGDALLEVNQVRSPPASMVERFKEDTDFVLTFVRE